MFSGQWNGLLWSSVPGCWPPTGTLQGCLHPSEGSVGAAGQDDTQYWCLRRWGVWHCIMYVFVCCFFLHWWTFCCKAVILFYTFNRLEMFLILLDFHVSLKWFTACWISALSFPTWIWHCMQTRGNSLSSQWARNIKKNTVFMTYWIQWLF